MTQSVSSLLTSSLNSQGSLIHISSNIGEVKEVYKGDSPYFILHIQNAHANETAQRNVEAILKQVYQKDFYPLIQLEGSDAQLDPEVFHFFPNSELNIRVADEAVRRGLLTGAELFALTLNEKGYSNLKSPTPLIQGVEEIKAYTQSLKRIQSGLKQKNQFEASLNRVQTQMNKEQSLGWNKELFEFSRKTQNFKSNPNSILKYIHYLNKLMQKHLNIDLSHSFYQKQYPYVCRILKLQELEISQFQLSAKQEVDRLEKDIQGWNQSEESVKQGLVQGLQALKANLDSHPEGNIRSFFEILYLEAEKNKFSWMSFEAFKKWAAFLIIQQEVKGVDLYQELEQLTSQLYKRFVKTKEEQYLLDRSRLWEFIAKILRFELTSQDWKEYLLLKESFSLLVGESELQEGVDNAVEFYQLSEARNKVLFQNTLENLKKHNKEKTVLVTGGFHTSGITRLMREEGISYVVVSPKMGSDYEVTGYQQQLLNLNEELDASTLELPLRTMRDIDDLNRHHLDVKAQLNMELDLVLQFFPEWVKGESDLELIAKRLRDVIERHPHLNRVGYKILVEEGRIRVLNPNGEEYHRLSKKDLNVSTSMNAASLGAPIFMDMESFASDLIYLYERLDPKRFDSEAVKLQNNSKEILEVKSKVFDVLERLATKRVIHVSVKIALEKLFNPKKKGGKKGKKIKLIRNSKYRFSEVQILLLLRELLLHDGEELSSLPKHPQYEDIHLVYSFHENHASTRDFEIIAGELDKVVQKAHQEERPLVVISDVDYMGYDELIDYLTGKENGIKQQLNGKYKFGLGKIQSLSATSVKAVFARISAMLKEGYDEPTIITSLMNKDEVFQKLLIELVGKHWEHERKKAKDIREFVKKEPETPFHKAYVEWLYELDKQIRAKKLKVKAFSHLLETTPTGSMSEKRVMLNILFMRALQALKRGDMEKVNYFIKGFNRFMIDLTRVRKEALALQIQDIKRSKPNAIILAVREHSMKGVEKKMSEAGYVVDVSEMDEGYRDLVSEPLYQLHDPERDDIAFSEQETVEERRYFRDFFAFNVIAYIKRLDEFKDIFNRLDTEVVSLIYKNLVELLSAPEIEALITEVMPFVTESLSITKPELIRKKAEEVFYQYAVEKKGFDILTVLEMAKTLAKLEYTSSTYVAGLDQEVVERIRRVREVASSEEREVDNAAIETDESDGEQVNLVLEQLESNITQYKIEGELAPLVSKATSIFEDRTLFLETLNRYAETRDLSFLQQRAKELEESGFYSLVKGNLNDIIIFARDQGLVSKEVFSQWTKFFPKKLKKKKNKKKKIISTAKYKYTDAELLLLFQDMFLGEIATAQLPKSSRFQDIHMIYGSFDTYMRKKDFEAMEPALNAAIRKAEAEKRPVIYIKEEPQLNVGDFWKYLGMLEYVHNKKGADYYRFVVGEGESAQTLSKIENIPANQIQNLLVEISQWQREGVDALTMWGRVIFRREKFEKLVEEIFKLDYQLRIKGGRKLENYNIENFPPFQKRMYQWLQDLNQRFEVGELNIPHFYFEQDDLIDYEGRMQFFRFQISQMRLMRALSEGEEKVLQHLQEQAIMWKKVLEARRHSLINQIKHLKAKNPRATIIVVRDHIFQGVHEPLLQNGFDVHVHRYLDSLKSDTLLTRVYQNTKNSTRVSEEDQLRHLVAFRLLDRLKDDEAYKEYLNTLENQRMGRIYEYFFKSFTRGQLKFLFDEIVKPNSFGKNESESNSILTEGIFDFAKLTFDVSVERLRAIADTEEELELMGAQTVVSKFEDWEAIALFQRNLKEQYDLVQKETQKPEEPLEDVFASSSDDAVVIDEDAIPEASVPLLPEPTIEEPKNEIPENNAEGVAQEEVFLASSAEPEVESLSSEVVEVQVNAVGESARASEEIATPEIVLPTKRNAEELFKFVAELSELNPDTKKIVVELFFYELGRLLSFQYLSGKGVGEEMLKHIEVNFDNGSVQWSVMEVAQIDSDPTLFSKVLSQVYELAQSFDGVEEKERYFFFFIEGIKTTFGEDLKGYKAFLRTFYGPLKTVTSKAAAISNLMRKFVLRVRSVEVSGDADAPMDIIKNYVLSEAKSLGEGDLLNSAKASRVFAYEILGFEFYDPGNEMDYIKIMEEWGYGALAYNLDQRVLILEPSFVKAQWSQIQILMGLGVKFVVYGEEESLTPELLQWIREIEMISFIRKQDGALLHQLKIELRRNVNVEQVVFVGREAIARDDIFQFVYPDPFELAPETPVLLQALYLFKNRDFFNDWIENNQLVFRLELLTQQLMDGQQVLLALKRAA